ncbi:MAG: transcription elongation factor GreB [Rhodospirillaceae bacterium]|nr:transcription elongation factor GreB [Rhodospirillaceae bacterium]
MSKAFTKETDGAEEADDDGAADLLPAGGKNYVTPEGLQRLQDEFRQLQRVERPKVVEIVSWAAGNGDRSENGDYIYGKRRLREIDRRLRYLLKRIESAELVDPRRQKNREQVFFGAIVTYANSRDEEKTIRIVGIDEADPDRGAVSWTSPIARALLKARAGDVVQVRTPSGPDPIEIVEIAYAES